MIFKKLFSTSKLSKALAKKDLTLLLKAIRAGEDLNQPLRLTDTDETLAPPVIHALLRGDDSCLQKLLDAGAQLPETNPEGQLLLSIAITSQNALSLTTCLLQAGADANANQGEPLFACLALADDNLALLLSSRLLQYGADLNSFTYQGHSALGQLLLQERTLLIGALISAGAELPDDLELLACSDEIKRFARRKASDIAIQRQFLAQ